MPRLVSVSLPLPPVTIHDPDSIDYFKNLSESELELELQRVIEIGVSVIQRVNMQTEANYLEHRGEQILNRVENSFEKLAQSLETSLETSLNPHRDGSLLAQTRSLIKEEIRYVQESLKETIQHAKETLADKTQVLAATTENLGYKFDPNNTTSYLSQIDRQLNSFAISLQQQFSESNTGSFAHQLRQQLMQHFGENSPVVKKIEQHLKLDLAGTSPLSQVFKEIQIEIQQLRDLVIQSISKQSALEETIAKGYPFEDQVESRLHEIAAPHGDWVENVSTTAEVMNSSKKGDYNYVVGTKQLRITIDAKSHQSIKSLPGMLKLLDQAMRDREASFGIIVVPEKQNLQKQIGEWNFYDGNKIITPLEHLETSIKFARCVSELKEREDVEVDKCKVQNSVETLRRKLKEFSTVKAKLTKISNGIVSTTQDLHNLLDDIRASIAQQVEEIENSVC